MTRRVTAALLLGLGLVACEFERRADREGAVPVDASSEAAAPDRAPGADDSVLDLVDQFHRALESGDAARLATLTGPDALIIDQEEGILWSAERGGALPGPLQAERGPYAGFRWALIGTRVDAVGPARLVMRRYRATIVDEAVPWWAVETILLEPAPSGGWRIHYVHRSRGQGSPG